MTRDDASTAPRLLELLSEVIERPDDLQSTGIYVRGGSTVHADQLSDDRIVVLDTHHFLLMVYHTETGRVDTVAVNDEGPGGVAYATDMDVYRDTVYVSTMDYRVRRFDCSAECAYAGITTVGYAARGVAARDGRVSLLVSDYVEGEENYGMPARLVHRLVGEDVDLRFMDAYTSANPLVDWEMNNGFVAHAGGYDVFVFSHMPYLYIFEEGQPVAMFEIEEFHPMEREEGVDPYSISMPTAAVMSNISRVQNYSADELFVVVRRAQRLDRDDISVSVDYYLVDMATMTPAHVGTSTFGAEGGPDVIPTEDYAIVIEDGEVKYLAR